MSNAVHQPLEATDLTDQFCRDNLPALTNKLTLSNFVSHDFLIQLDRVFELLPESLRHGYSASGMSECVDKLVKSIWLRRKPRMRLVAVGESFFGHGSFISRALSGCADSLFQCTNIPENDQLLESLERQISTDAVLAVFLEPLGCLTGRRISKDSLKQISRLCKKHNTPLVTHDSAGMFHRYSTDAFLPAAIEGYEPDAGMIFLGGQMAICFMKDEFFVETPLMMISTWDGDAFSLAQFDLAVSLASKQDMPKLMRRFHHLLESKLTDNGVTEYDLAGGVGWFRGPIEEELGSMFRRSGENRFISCPGVSAIKKFLAHFSG